MICAGRDGEDDLDLLPPVSCESKISQDMNDWMVGWLGGRTVRVKTARLRLHIQEG